MKTHKETGLLIERLKTYEIDNLQEIATEFTGTFNEIMRDLEENRYWHYARFDTAMMMCHHFTLNGEKVELSSFHKFFKTPSDD